LTSPIGSDDGDQDIDPAQGIVDDFTKVYSERSVRLR
jgi:hypothetical protein